MLLVCVFIFAACDDSSPPDSGDPGSSAGQPPPTSPPPPPPAVYTIDFTGGETGFLKLNLGAVDIDLLSTMEIANSPDDGSPALKLTAPDTGVFRFGICVDGLLGDAVTDVKTIEVIVYADYPSGTLRPLTGRLSAIVAGSGLPIHNDWTIFNDRTNPNRAVFEFSSGGFTAGGPNMLEFSCLNNGPVSRGEAAAVVYIKSINFYDASFDGLAVDMKTSWKGPAAYGEPDKIVEHELPWPPKYGDPGGWQRWYTQGYDDEPDDYATWEIIQKSIGFVLEMEEPTDGIELYYHGSFDWTWQQRQLMDFWADGLLTVKWEDVGFDTSLLGEDNPAVSFGIGNWNHFEITRAYLMVVVPAGE